MRVDRGSVHRGSVGPWVRAVRALRGVGSWFRGRRYGSARAGSVGCWTTPLRFVRLHCGSARSCGVRQLPEIGTLADWLSAGRARPCALSRGTGGETQRLRRMEAARAVRLCHTRVVICPPLFLAPPHPLKCSTVRCALRSPSAASAPHKNWPMSDMEPPLTRRSGSSRNTSMTGTGQRSIALSASGWHAVTVTASFKLDRAADCTTSTIVLKSLRCPAASGTSSRKLPPPVFRQSAPERFSHICSHSSTCDAPCTTAKPSV
mmetsp:Transcript_20118/g.44899  ORF Transcript_20118/g.44899 Transcript_20118/m.44899 type:complete len:262 (-) Transcript_20118:22-807(-)